MSFTAQILWTVFRLSNCFDQLQTRLLQSMTPRGPRGGVKFSNSPFSNIIRPNRIKLPSSRSKRRKYELKKEKISATRGAVRADLFYWDSLILLSSPLLGCYQNVFLTTPEIKLFLSDLMSKFNLYNLYLLKDLLKFFEKRQIGKNLRD